MARQAHEKVRASREQEMRESEDVHEEEDAPWERPTSLEAPFPRPGMRQRWVRVGTLNRDDATNLARKLREGWKPRQADTIPDTYKYPTLQNGQFAGFVGVEQMVLMEMPEKRWRQRRDYYRNLTNLRTQALDSQLDRTNSALRNNAFGPIKTEERSSKQVRLRKVPVAADENLADTDD